MTHSDREAAGFRDASLWELTKFRGKRAIRQMIGAALYKTSVTVVLIGDETHSREYIQHEIAQSYSLRKAFSVYVSITLPTDAGKLTGRVEILWRCYATQEPAILCQIFSRPTTGLVTTAITTLATEYRKRRESPPLVRK